MIIPAAVFIAVVVLACWTTFTGPPPIDFVSFWNAAVLVLQGRPAAVYELQPSPYGNIMPLAYPPAALLFIAPFGMMSFAPAFLAWTLLTGGLFLSALRGDRWVALATPPVAANGMIGQNGFLTAAILLGGTRLLASRPMLGGAVLGLLVIKPHLALLIPIALVAGRYWTSLLGAAVSAAALLLLAAAVFGLEVYRGFLDVVPQSSAFLFAGRWPWNEVASVYALARWLGASHVPAIALHSIVASLAAVATWHAWSRDLQVKVPVLAAGTLLISPYLFTYDAVMLAAPLVWLARNRPAAAAAVWCLAALPLLRSFLPYAGPNGVPMAAALSLVFLLSPRPFPRAPRSVGDPMAISDVHPA